MKIGDYEVSSIEMGRFRLDGGAMFGPVPKVIWEKTNPADDRNRIQMSLRALLIKGAERSILVDTGIGTKWQPKYLDMFAIDPAGDKVDIELARQGIKRDQITDIFLTHLHFDHVGGVTYTNKGKPEFSFANAQYHVHEAQLQYAKAPSEKDKSSFLRENIQPMEESGKLHVLNEGGEVCPGVSLWVTHGHTPGQQLVCVADDKNTVFFCGDTIPTSSHIHVPYVMAYDLHPLTTIEEKKAILEKAVFNNWILAFSHDPNISACTIKLEDRKYQLSKIVEM